MKYLMVLVLATLVSLNCFNKSEIMDFEEYAFLRKDFPLYKNGDCVAHNFDSNIQYAISGKAGSYYQLVVWEDGKPRSMVMGTPAHSSDRVIGKMFHKINCEVKEISFTYEIYDDFYDPYRDTSPVFIGYM